MPVVSFFSSLIFNSQDGARIPLSGYFFSTTRTVVEQLFIHKFPSYSFFSAVCFEYQIVILVELANHISLALSRRNYEPFDTHKFQYHNTCFQVPMLLGPLSALVMVLAKQFNVQAGNYSFAKLAIGYIQLKTIMKGIKDQKSKKIRSKLELRLRVREP